MSEPAFRMPNDRYEQACDQAIAMCSGSSRGAIKALIMANEYLEAELLELRATVSVSRGVTPQPASNPRAALEAALLNRVDGDD